MIFLEIYLKVYLQTFDVKSWQEWMLSGLFYSTVASPALAERAGLSHLRKTWSLKMAMAVNLNVKEFHIQVLGCDEAAIKFLAQ